MICTPKCLARNRRGQDPAFLLESDVYFKGCSLSGDGLALPKVKVGSEYILNKSLPLVEAKPSDSWILTAKRRKWTRKRDEGLRSLNQTAAMTMVSSFENVNYFDHREEMYVFIFFWFSFNVVVLSFIRLSTLIRISLVKVRRITA